MKNHLSVRQQAVRFAKKYKCPVFVSRSGKGYEFSFKPSVDSIYITHPDGRCDAVKSRAVK